MARGAVSATKPERRHTTMAAPEACCAYCHDADESVVPVGECADRCAVRAHAACAARRRTTAVWRKKHAHRGRGDPELCPYADCGARFTPKPREVAAEAKAAPPWARDERRAVANGAPPSTGTPCAFFARDGQPCRRDAVAHGACRLHAHDALVLRLLTARLEEDAETGVASQAAPSTAAKTTQAAPRARDAATQTEASVAEAELRRDLAGARAALAQARAAALTEAAAAVSAMAVLA